MAYQKRVADVISSSLAASVKVPITRQQEHLMEIATSIENLFEGITHLAEALKTIPHDDEDKASFHMHAKVVSSMSEVRKHSDHLETIVDDDLWPLCKFSEMLFLR
eukprot:TRINITY_DN4267_c0_g1_i1.p1 TRINITY_DN4267_c0_g1~~TRINITY_DN4267_c0_g1_i1.p1  ORF type:complete len:106 (+),score=38.60 TRINITY_DN4267_c0_g1_i1:337-654(+)